MFDNVRNLVHMRDLLSAWTWRVVRARYQQSLLGGLWAVVQPMATVAIFSLVFTRFVRVQTEGIPYVLFSYIAVVPWTLFSTSVADMTNSLVDNMNLVSKIYFPREVLPIAAMLARLLDFVIATAVLCLLMVYFSTPVLHTGWLYLPIILAIQMTLALGLGLIAAALNVFYRDIRHLVLLGLQLWLYASPVIYSASSVPASLRSLYFLNPMAVVVEAYRGALLQRTAFDTHMVWAGVTAAIVLFAGYWFFKRVEFEFADVV